MAIGVDLERLYDEHAEAVYRFLLNLTGREESTRELLQELFLKIAAAPRRLDGVRNQRSFLIRLAHNLFRDSLRRQAARDKYQDAASEEISLFAPTDDPDAGHFRQRLSAALLTLPLEQRAVVYLKLWGEMTFEQIANALGISANTAASRLRYGVDKLRGQLRPLYDEIQ